MSERPEEGCLFRLGESGCDGVSGHAVVLVHERLDSRSVFVGEIQEKAFEGCFMSILGSLLETKLEVQVFRIRLPDCVNIARLRPL